MTAIYFKGKWREAFEESNDGEDQVQSEQDLETACGKYENDNQRPLSDSGDAL